jgi:hypothetical protein
MDGAQDAKSRILHQKFEANRSDRRNNMLAFFSLTNPFFYAATLWAAFFGWRAVSIFGPAQDQKAKQWDWWLYQIWFNALGAFLGWVAVWYLTCVRPSDLKVEHWLACLVAFLGVTGNLPYASLLGRVK